MLHSNKSLHYLAVLRKNSLSFPACMRQGRVLTLFLLLWSCVPCCLKLCLCCPKGTTSCSKTDLACLLQTLRLWFDIAAEENAGRANGFIIVPSVFLDQADDGRQHLQKEAVYCTCDPSLWQLGAFVWRRCVHILNTPGAATTHISPFCKAMKERPSPGVWEP